MPSSPLILDLYCCDHLYYRGQAEFWTGLSSAQISDIPDQNRLWDVIENRETYYEIANGLSSQPPYVFRPLIPLIAGLLGHLIGIDTAFFGVNLISLFLLGYFTGIVTVRLIRNLTVAALVAIGVLLLPEVGRSYLFDYMLVDPASFALVAATLYFIVTKHWVVAGILSGIVAPLTKETLVALALTVTLAALLSGVRSHWLWLLPLTPVVIQMMLRLLITVPEPPSISVLIIPGEQVRPAETLIAAFVAVSFLFYGLVSQRIRLLLVSFTPMILLLIVITSSSVADSQRIWLTLWPVIIILGTVGLYNFFETSPLRFFWFVLPFLAFIWLHYGLDFQSTNQPIFFALDYGLILIPPTLIGLEYLRRQFFLESVDQEPTFGLDQDSSAWR